MSEIVTIGNATLYHGDCLEIMPTLGKVDAVVTDPPYGMAFQSNHYGPNANQSGHDKISGDDNPDLLLWACSIPVDHSRYVFGRWSALKIIPTPKSHITWVKDNWSMGDLNHEHARQSESLFFWSGENHCFPAGRPSDVLNSPRGKNEQHPTQKPVLLMEKIIGWTKGAVFDPFMGSGTTGVACMNLGRKFIGIELERKYFDIACERIDMAQRQTRLFA